MTLKKTMQSCGHISLFRKTWQIDLLLFFRCPLEAAPVPINDLNVVSDELPSWAVAGVYHQHNIDHGPMLKDGVIARGLATEQLTRAVEAHERVGHGLEVTG